MEIQPISMLFSLHFTRSLIALIASDIYWLGPAIYWEGQEQRQGGLYFGHTVNPRLFSVIKEKPWFPGLNRVDEVRVDVWNTSPTSLV